MSTHAERFELARILGLVAADQVVTIDANGVLSIVTMTGKQFLIKSKSSTSIAGITLDQNQYWHISAGQLEAADFGASTIMARLAAGDFADKTFAQVEAEWPYGETRAIQKGLTLATANVAISVNNSSTMTTIFAPTIPADLLGIDGGVRAEMWGTYTNDTGVNKLLDWQIDVDSTTYLATLSSVIIAAIAYPRMWYMIVDVWGDANASAQQLWMDFRMGSGQNHTTGQGGGTNRYLGGAYINNNPFSKDSSGDLVLDIQMRHTTAHASLTFTMEQATFKVIR